MKRFNKKRGISPRPVPPVIRWLGVYGSIQAESLKWEINPNREVACAPLHRGANGLWESSIQGILGLLVDTDETELVRCYASDAYTSHHGVGKFNSSSRESYIPSVTSWDQVDGLPVDRKRRNNGDANHYRPYREALIRKPVYRAIVVGSQKDREWLEKAQILWDTDNIPRKYTWLGKALFTGYLHQLPILTLEEVRRE